MEEKSSEQQKTYLLLAQKSYLYLVGKKVKDGCFCLVDFLFVCFCFGKKKEEAKNKKFIFNTGKNAENSTNFLKLAMKHEARVYSL